MREVVNMGIVFKVISRILYIISGALIFCAGIAFFYREETGPFLMPSLISLSGGAVLHLFTFRQKREKPVHRKDAYLAVTLSWLLVSLIGCLPFILSGYIPSFVDAFFESISGFSTTGASILTDIEFLSKPVLFWRSLTHWIGGIGIIVLMILIMPSLHIGNYHLFTLESSLKEKIQPKIVKVGYRILIIYCTLTLAEILLLMLGGMNLFESACHAFGTVATGGFSPKNSSIIEYSPYIQYVIMLFMLLSGINYVIHYSLIKRRFSKIRENEEVRFYLLVVFIISSLITLSLYAGLHRPFEQAFREAFFQVISIITCTGFASADYMLWPSYAWFTIFLCMFLGGSTGSTAGGIKMARHLVLLKNLNRSFRQITHPQLIRRIQLNQNSLDEESNNSILSFIQIYTIVFVIGTAALMLSGLDAMVAGSSAATCMAGIGPGLGSVGPVGNYAHLPVLAKLILSGLMLAGRLEIYTVLMLFTREFWKN